MPSRLRPGFLLRKFEMWACLESGLAGEAEAGQLAGFDAIP